MSVQILTSKHTIRQEYILNFIFEQILNLKINYYKEYNGFLAADGIKFNYTNKKIDNIPSLKPSSLLFDSSINPEIYISCKEEGITKTFATTTNLSFPDFDLFAASFFLLSRYEEFVNPNRDEHNRFCATDSLSFKQGILEKPVIDQWAYQLKSELQDWYPEEKFPERTFNAISTIDVDNNYAYLHKSLFRHMGSSIRSIIKGDFRDLKTRFRVLSGKRKDPFDTYEYLFHLHEQHNLNLLFFILTANYGRYDKNHPVKSKAFQRLVKKLAAKAKVGIHPSYAAHKDEKEIQNEKQALEKIINIKITRSRQHFLKMSLPETYQRLIVSGIQEDFTMGYHDHLGFRAGTCTPFIYFDLQKNEPTTLVVYPFAAMDITLRQYMKLTTDNAKQTLKQLMACVRQVNGTWVNLWHNESVSDFREWENWKEVFEFSLKLMKQGGSSSAK